MSSDGVLEDVVIRPLHDSDAEVLIDKLPFPNCKGRLWDWQFSGSGLSGKNQSLVLVVDNTICGFNGVMPVNAYVNGEATRLFWSCDFALEACYRGRGFGRALKHHLKNLHKNEMIASLGISDSAYQLLLTMGWVSSTVVKEFRREKFIPSLKGVVKCLIQNWNYIFYGAISVLTYCKRGGGEVSEQAQLPIAEEVDALWDKSKCQYEAIIARNYQYLSWKYTQHPLASSRYRYFLWRDRYGYLQSILIVREYDGGVDIVDYLGYKKDYQGKRKLIKFVLKSFSNKKIFRVLCSDLELQNVLRSCGFYRPNNNQRFVVWDKAGNASKLDWFIMAGDSDGELLAAARANE